MFHSLYGLMSLTLTLSLSPSGLMSLSLPPLSGLMSLSLHLSLYLMYDESHSHSLTLSPPSGLMSPPLSLSCSPSPSGLVTPRSSHSHSFSLTPPGVFDLADPYGRPAGHIQVSLRWKLPYVSPVSDGEVEPPQAEKTEPPVRKPRSQKDGDVTKAPSRGAAPPERSSAQVRTPSRTHPSIYTSLL